jgi:thiosulfate/3-mercaptopyruvate sulfurtransferase
MFRSLRARPAALRAHLAKVLAPVMAVVLAVVLPTPPAQAAADPSRLVSAEWLQQALQAQPAPGAGLLVLDASPAPAFRQGHIPGAVHVDPFSMAARDGTPAELQQRLRSWGIRQGAGQRIVVVDAGGSWMAPRLFWELMHQGVPLSRLHLLDGGMARWRALGGSTSTGAVPPVPGDFTLPAAAVESIRVRLPEFLAASADPTRHVMLEALPPEYFYGGIGWFDRPGHVPHATLWPAEDFFNADKTFRHADELQRVATHLGITPAQQVLSYCGGGGAAAVPFFALRFLLGHEDVRLFVESQRGWLQDPRELPVWHYAEPQRLRDAPWLATWAGAMLRGFGLSKVTVVDLRPREAFATGHVPQALNLPLAELHALRHEPEALASMLGRAGLDSSHEAVVLSARGGLDGDAALGALLLERAGQRRVSVYAGTLDSWVDGGRELARPASPPATVRASAYAAYAPRTRPLLVRVAPEATALPSVWISATEAAPAGLAPDGSAWLHLPVPALLTATSRPRPASEIWAELDRRGLPRHARVMLRGDDEAALAEAARLRVVLAMMGWRELLVWAP